MQYCNSVIFFSRKILTLYKICFPRDGRRGDIKLRNLKNKMKHSTSNQNLPVLGKCYIKLVLLDMFVQLIFFFKKINISFLPGSKLRILRFVIITMFSRRAGK